MFSKEFFHTNQTGIFLWTCLTNSKSLSNKSRRECKEVNKRKTCGCVMSAFGQVST